MKKIFFFLAVAVLVASCARTETTLIWNEMPADPETGLYTHEILVCNPPQNLDWDMWGYLYYKKNPTEHPSSEMTFNRFESKEFVMTPKVVKDTLRLLFTTRAVEHSSHYPKGFYLREGKRVKALPIKLNPLPVDTIPDGTYRRMELRAADIIPQPKSVEYLEGFTPVSEPEIKMVEGRKPSWYKLTVNGSITIEASDENGLRYAKNTLSQIAKDGKVGNLEIEDWPDFGIRSQHIDCARCFYKVEDLKKIITLLARFKMNYLHLHLTDDEGWRLEIDGLPELVSYGAFHALPERQADGSFKCPVAPSPVVDGLLPGKEFGGSNGYYSREEFKDILRFADENGITVIPEFDMPAHSRACVMAMEHRYETTGDATYLLSDPNDTSKTVSVQKFNHNVINAGLPSAYKFIEKVVDETARLYEEVGLKLETLHIGGDEVPDGSWMGSPACQKLMKEEGISTKNELMEYFFIKFADILSSRGIGLSAWGSMTDRFSDKGLEKAAEVASFLVVPAPQNETHFRALQPVRATNAGIKVLVGSADYYYMDNAYSDSFAEPGLSWCGSTNERKVFSYRPYEINYVPTEGDIKKNGADYVYESTFSHPELIAGTEACLWGDAICNFDQAMERLFPKGIGAFERAWNARPEGEKADFDKFYSIVVDKALPYLEGNGIRFRKPMKAE